MDMPRIRRNNKPKTPSAAAAAAQQAEQHVRALTTRWELQAIERGSQDPAAQQQATRVLQQLTQYLAQNRSSCKHGAIRVLLQKQLPAELLLNLLGSGHAEVLSAALAVLQDLAHIVPAVLPVDAAPQLLHLLCCQNHGAAAARVLTAQLTHWRVSQLLPHWVAAGSTNQLYQHLQQLHVLAQAPEASGSSTASRAADACVSMLMLLAKMASLAEQQMLLQLTPDVDAATRWLRLLVDVGRQQAGLAGSHASLQLQDSCCALLASFSRAPATSHALLTSTQLRQSVLQLLHGVLRRPCCVSEADASHIQCWTHAATAASLPAVWQQRHGTQHDAQHQQATLAPHEEQQLLADVAIAAAATLCNECFNSGAVAKQVDAAAASLLAAALLPCAAAYGSQCSCLSRFMAAVLGSSCCHVLLHALAVSTNTSSEQAAVLAAAAAAATASALQASAGPAGTRPVTPDRAHVQPGAAAAGQADPASAGGMAALVPVQQELQPAWLLLRMICAQCAAAVAAEQGRGAVGTRSSAAPFGVHQPPTAANGGSSAGGSQGPPTHVRQQMALLHVASSNGRGPAVQPEQVLRVVQAYSSHESGADAHRVPGLLRSLHFLMCQAVLRPCQQERDPQRQQGQQRQQQQAQLPWLSLDTPGATSSSSSSSTEDRQEGVPQFGASGQQLLSSAAAVLDLIAECEGSIWSAGDTPAAATSAGPAGSTSRPSGVSTHQLSWALCASVYAGLAVTVHLQESLSLAGAEAGCQLSAADSCLALAALQLAAAALRLLLPVVVSHAPHGQAAAAVAPARTGSTQQPAQQQRFKQLLAIPVHEALECSLAAVQALAMLSSLLQPALPGLLWQFINNNSGGGNPEGVKPAVMQASVVAAAAALDADLQQELSQVVLSWQAVSGCSTLQDACRARAGAEPNMPTQLSVHAALQQHLQQELRCWAAVALASCYGQLGARTWQGAVLEQFRQVHASFADTLLQLGPSRQTAGHAAVLAAGCPVLRQQLVAAAAASATATPPAAAAHSGTPGGSGQRTDEGGGSAGVPGGSPLALRFSAAVDSQAFEQALDFVYTGAATLAHAGLASQLQLCSSCLLPAGANGSSKQASQQKLAALQHRQLQELQEQQQAARQQLHRLGMLARKLQLPLLAALTRASRPQPGQVLPDLHLSFAALLPSQLLLCAAGDPHIQEEPSGAGRAAAGEWGVVGDCEQQGGQHADQQRQLEAPQQGCVLPAEHAAEGLQHQHQQQACLHSSSADYLTLLAACAAAAADGLGGDTQQVAGPGCHALPRLPCVSSPLLGHDSSFADVFMAAPALLLPCGAAAGEGPAGQQVVYGLLPAHRVMLSACCPYFEALLSERWHQDSCAHAPAVAGALPRAVEVPRVVVVPEADIYVAAALQHYQYTGSLRVQLPAHCSPGGLPGALAAAGDRVGTGGVQAQQQQSAAHTCLGVCTDGPQAGQAPAIALSGCSQACHEARTLLRLWRCAELLLLPGLQAMCVAAVDAAAWVLPINCCLVLLSDCCQLGVPAVDGLLAALTQRADRDTAADCGEWTELPAGLQAVLTKAWAERRRLQQEGEDDAAVATGPHAASAAASGGLGQQPPLVLQPPEMPNEPVLVPWKRLQVLREAAEHLGGIVSMQLVNAKG